MKTARTATLVALAALACIQDRQQREGPTGLTSLVRDSAGIQIVENPAPPAGSRLGWRIGPEPGVSIGSSDGEEPYLLYLAYDATILTDGRIVVADGACAARSSPCGIGKTWIRSSWSSGTAKADCEPRWERIRAGTRT